MPGKLENGNSSSLPAGKRNERVVIHEPLIPSSVRHQLGNHLTVAIGNLEAVLDSAEISSEVVSLVQKAMAACDAANEVLKSTQVRAVDGSKQGARPANQCTLLIVDDADYIRDVAASMLRPLGFHSIEVASGEDCLQVLSQDIGKRIGGVFLDIVMPDMTWEETLAKIRSIRPDVPVIFMTGSTTELTRIRELSPSNVGYIMKPFKASELVNELSRVAMS